MAKDKSKDAKGVTKKHDGLYKRVTDLEYRQATLLSRIIELEKHVVKPMVDAPADGSKGKNENPYPA